MGRHHVVNSALCTTSVGFGGSRREQLHYLGSDQVTPPPPVGALEATAGLHGRRALSLPVGAHAPCQVSAGITLPRWKKRPLFVKAPLHCRTGFSCRQH